MQRKKLLHDESQSSDSFRNFKLGWLTVTLLCGSVSGYLLDCLYQPSLYPELTH